MSLKAGDSFPQDVTFSYVTQFSPQIPPLCPTNFRLKPAAPPPLLQNTPSITNTPPRLTHLSISYIPWSEDSSEITSCGIPINYFASKEWADKKVILFALPGSSPLLPNF
jgi:hypothetical protein